MRESEEYLKESIYWSRDLDENREVVIKVDAEHAVKLAYKEGLLKAKELMDKTFGEILTYEMSVYRAELKGLIDEV